jgi:hypothetical protein
VVVVETALFLIARSEAPSNVPTPTKAPASGSAQEEPGGDFDSQVAVGKGERNDPFTISSHSQREVVESLTWKSTACIWGGPAVTLASLYFLWTYWTWM